MILTLLVALKNFKFHFDGNLGVTYKPTHIRGKGIMFTVFVSFLIMFSV